MELNPGRWPPRKFRQCSCSFQTYYVMFLTQAVLRYIPAHATGSQSDGVREKWPMFRPAFGAAKPRFTSLFFSTVPSRTHLRVCT